MKYKKLIIVAIVTLLCLQIFAAAAYEEVKLGSVLIRVETLADDTPVPGYALHFSSVADPEGYLDEEFLGAGIRPAVMLDERNNTVNAEKLCNYAKKNDISGALVVTDGKGEVCISELDAGIYLVWPGEENELTFNPYLIYVPTVINGIEYWNVISMPKVGLEPEEPDSPQPPPGPGIIPLPTPTPGLEPSPAPTPTPGTEPSPIPTPGTEPSPSPDPTPGGPVKPQIPQTGINRLPVLLLFAFGIGFAALGIVLIVREKVEGDDE